MKIRMLAIAVLVAALAPAVVLAGSAKMSPELSAKLKGGSEVPKGPAAGHGIVNLTLSAAKGTVCWHFEGIGGFDKPTAAHIHKAPIGKAGPVVVPFSSAYKAKGCAKATKGLITAIEAHPNSYYVNIHSAKYPAGAIRGQLVAGMMTM
jgi:hypothetical protein